MVTHTQAPTIHGGLLHRIVGVSLNPVQISTRRVQLGEQPLATLFACLGHPIATPHTRGAFCFGKRLVALESVPDIQTNRAAFGYDGTGDARSPYQQVRCDYLAEYLVCLP